ncbi:MAG TPA: prepilin-type N-terminal cleavage/methylation domain-containing protein [Vicinamibacterales bacterium]|nr:prepilin-type N-terminal cleavage/methylation domain-containing protein [Vicinamibacterales bacterium]
MTRTDMPNRIRRSDDGSSLVEVVVAMAIMATLAAGLMAMAGIALTQSENQGHLAARTAEYAQDKMEQLLVLAFGDAATDTRVFPAASNGGTGLAVGGSANPAAPVDGYVDYLDARGNLLAPPGGGGAPAGWFYARAWQVTSLSATLKEVRVTATVARGIGRQQTPTATLVTLKTFPF